MEPQHAALVAAGMATCGWLYTARRARALSRKQHTVTVMLQASLNSEYRKCLKKLVPHLRGEQKLDLDASPDDEELADAFRMVANHYEFLAAGLRNGDFDERLVRDSQRGIVLHLYESCHEYIWKVRNNRRRQTLYEHLEWLYKRWETKPPSRVQRCCEHITARPWAGRRVNPHA